MPELPWVAELRAHPELAAHPLAIASAPGPRAELVSVSPEAAAEGIRTGTTVAHARSIYAELRVRIASPALDRAARDALLDVAFSLSPRAAPVTPGSGIFSSEAAVWLDASGMGSLFPSERGFASALLARAADVGLQGSVVAIASSRALALLTTRSAAPGEIHLVPAGEEAAFFGPLPVDLLDPDVDVASRLTRFGVYRIEELLRLPARALGTRVGPDILRLVNLARGRESGPPLPAAPERRFEEALDLEYPVDRLEPLTFLLRGVLSRLVRRLELRGLACGDLDLELWVEGGGRDALRVGVAAPTLDVRVLLRLVQLAIESRPPDAAVETLSLATQGVLPHPDQLDLFRPPGPAPAVLSRTLAELESLCGEKRVGAPRVLDEYRPDAFEIEPFSPQSVCDAPAPPVATENLALRILRPPVAAQVRSRGGRPEWITSAVVTGPVTSCAGPWRITGGWWSEERFAVDHYDIHTEVGLVVRLRYDALERRWSVDGVYD